MTIKNLLPSACLLCLATLFWLTGCATIPNSVTGSAELSTAALSGKVHGGQQPVSGATVMLMLPGSTTYGAGATVLASTITDSSGAFTLPAYTCPANSGLVFLLATGGNSGSGNNSVLAEAALLGPCNLLTPATFINITEVTTVAAAYALAPFASVSPSGTGIGTSPTNLRGLANIVGATNNLVNAQTGNARGATELAGMVLPQTELNTLADILASCVNSSGSTASTAPCGMLFAAATPAGGVAPVDTFQVALDIALNPGTNVTALYNLSTASAPFLPTLSASPTDFALGIQYTGGGIASSYGTQGISIDSLGNAWIATGNVASNAGNTHTLTQITPTGLFPSGATGYGSTALSTPEGVAIDASNNVFVTDTYANRVFKFNSSGSLVSTFGPASLFAPLGIAIDIDNTLWVANDAARTISHLTAAGADATGSPYSTLSEGDGIVLNAAGNWTASYGSGSAGYLSHFADAHPGFGEATYTVSGTVEDVALDSSGNAWYTTRGSSSNGTVGRVSATGSSNLIPASVASPLQPASVFVDGLNHVWVVAYNQTTQSTPEVLLEYTSAGALLSPSSGYSANATLSSSPGFPEGIVVDGSGNLWVTGSFVDNSGATQANAVTTELIGIAAPVVTPIAVAASNGTLGTRP